MEYIIKVDKSIYAIAESRQEFYEYLEQIECEMGDELTITIDIKKIRIDNK